MTNEVIHGICNILHDYHRYNGFVINHDRVVNWVGQFDTESRDFVLGEFLHLLNQGIYVDETKARELLLKSLMDLGRRFKYTNLSDFLANADFVNLQEEGNSQLILLDLLDDVLKNKYSFSLAKCGTKSKKYVVYLDDILATGGTVFKDVSKWMSETENDAVTNYEKIKRGEKVFTVELFCMHTWGKENVEWRLKNKFDEKILGKLIYRAHYLVENHPSKQGQKLNFAYPDKNQSKTVSDYLDELPEKTTYTMTKRQYALRDPNKPTEEQFYSSSANRKKFEDLLLMKGLEILKRVEELSPNHRPMGVVNPSYQTLGVGTLFFTWRNISNTTPIVFWWNNNGWTPLFELINRGVG
jgi:hypothetical protein